MIGVRAYKAAFFDSLAVLKRLDKGKKKCLSKMGAFVRQRARSSIRSRRAVSAPGSPPSSHEGSMRRLLFFAYDESTGSVVVGPVPFRRGTAPGLLEYGGTSTRPATPRAPAKVLHYRPRQFMRPALDAELPKFAELLKGLM